jgi:hypothetical protein
LEEFAERWVCGIDIGSDRPMVGFGGRAAGEGEEATDEGEGDGSGEEEREGGSELALLRD